MSDLREGSWGISGARKVRASAGVGVGGARKVLLKHFAKLQKRSQQLQSDFVFLDR